MRCQTDSLVKLIDMKQFVGGGNKQRGYEEEKHSCGVKKNLGVVNVYYHYHEAVQSSYDREEYTGVGKYLFYDFFEGHI